MKYTALLLLLLPLAASAQSDSVDITFRYTPSANPSLVHLAGEFNNWANNSGGSISPDARWTMDKQADGSWAKTVRLAIGGGSGPGGSFQYKFNENGSSSGWLADPLNPRTYSGYGNSIITVRKPTVFHLQPGSGATVRSARPRIRADVFPARGTTIDVAASQVFVNGAPVAAFDTAYHPSACTLDITLPPVADGICLVTVRAVDSDGSSSEDSTRFTVAGAPLQWLTRSNPKVFDSSVTVHGLMQDAGIGSLRIVRNGTDTIAVTVNGTEFSATVALTGEINVLRALGELGGLPIVSDTLQFTRVIDRAPRPVIGWSYDGRLELITLSMFESTDGDGDSLMGIRWYWESEDWHNPSYIGLSQEMYGLGMYRPRTPGVYFIRLTGTDRAGHVGITRNYFVVGKDGSVRFGTVKDNPPWVTDAIVYEIFVPAFSPQGTIAGVTARLPALDSLGVNTLWLMPVFDNRGTTNDMNGGYDIIDFYHVDESLGTNADLRALIDSCHARGMRIILDMTPNHVSAEHPWVNDIRAWGEYSTVRDRIENRVLGDNRGLGQSVTSESGVPLYAHYSNWSLANLNLSAPGTRSDMLDVLRFWVDSMNVDGYRLDVYWGPQNRYGSAAWWTIAREELKRIKPEILLLGETDGTGLASEVNFADNGGACDAAYDWNWYSQIKSTLATQNTAALYERTVNYSPTLRYNEYSGEHAHYFRFLENHDEDRFAQVSSSIPRRMLPAAAVLLSAPGMPMLYAGQEVGWKGRRNRIDFSYADGTWLLPHYRRLIAIRSSISALRSPNIAPIASSPSQGILSYLRPARDENVLVAANFTGGAVGRVVLPIDESALELSTPAAADRDYYLNDLLNDTTFAVRRSGWASFAVPMEAYQSRILLFSDSAYFPFVPVEAPAPPAASASFRLTALYPNPAVAGSGDAVSIACDIPSASGASRVELTLWDALGRRVAELGTVDAAQGGTSVALRVPLPARLPAGWYRVQARLRSAGGAAAGDAVHSDAVRGDAVHSDAVRSDARALLLH